jgi:hypothetical protein
MHGELYETGERCAERPVLTTIDLQVTSFGNVSNGGAPKRKESLERGGDCDSARKDRASSM